MVSAGASRMSSVLGLKVTPSTAITLSRHEPSQRSSIFSIIRRLISSLTLMTLSTIWIGEA